MCKFLYTQLYIFICMRIYIIYYNYLLSLRPAKAYTHYIFLQQHFFKILFYERRIPLSIEFKNENFLIILYPLYLLIFLSFNIHICGYVRNITAVFNILFKFYYWKRCLKTDLVFKIDLKL